MVSETNEWASFFYEQVLMKNGFAPLYAVPFLIIDLVVPSRAIIVILMCHYVYLLYQWIVKPVREGWCTTSLLIFSVGWYVVALPTLWIYMSPQKQLLVYFYLTKIIPTYLDRAWAYLQIDGSSQDDVMLDYALARESLHLYSTCSFVFTHRDFWWPTFGLISSAVLILFLRGRWRWFDIWLSQLPPALCAGLLVELIMRCVHTQSMIVTGFLFTACFNFLKKYGNLDQVRVWEAQLFAQLPEYMALRWSRYQQSLAQRQKLRHFQYRALGKAEIRLLILRPPRWFFGIIEANIVHHPIDLAPDYEAVSYCWGSTDRTDEILIDGCRFAVTRSAFDLLLARRSIWRYRTLWIDAICINQDGLREKGAQVEMMREIYHQAIRVVIFTGSNWRARYAVPLILKIALAGFQYGENDWSSTEIFPREERSPRWKVLYELFENLYFTRVWIIQEIVTGRKVELYYGGHYIEWDLLLNVFALFLGPRRSVRLFKYGTSDNQIWSPSRTVDTIEIIGLLRPDFKERHMPTDVDQFRPDLENILFAANKFEATVAQDKVFGLVGLATNINHEELLKTDYQKTVEQVYEDATRVVMFPTVGQPSIHLLALAGTGFSTKRNKALPSWVPDFNEFRPGVPYTYLLAPKRRFFASGMSLPVITSGPGRDSLTLSGVVVDSLSALNASGPLQINIQNGALEVPEGTGNPLHRFLQSAIRLCNEHADKWPAENPVHERLWKVLIGGYMDYEPPDMRFKGIFRALIKLFEMVDQDSIDTAVDEPFKQEILTYIADESLHRYTSAMSAAASGRRFGITKRGRLCLLPPLSQEGDRIYVPLGAQTPFVIREHPANKELSLWKWEIVGEAFVDGIMDGEEMGKGLEISLVFG